MDLYLRVVVDPEKVEALDEAEKRLRRLAEEVADAARDARAAVYALRDSLTMKAVED